MCNTRFLENNFSCVGSGLISSYESVPGVNTRSAINVVSGLGLACWYRDSRLSPALRALLLHQHLAELHKVTLEQQELAMTVPADIEDRIEVVRQYVPGQSYH